MTTPAAEALYRAQHVAEMEGRPVAVFNPHGKPVNELPIIYAFPNSNEPGWISAIAIAEDGTCLGSHLCSHEAYIPHDLGVLEGARKDRHEESYQVHYPNGYRMALVPIFEVKTHEGLERAFQLNQQQAKEAKANDEAA